MIRRLKLPLVLPMVAITFTGVFFTSIGMGAAAEPTGLPIDSINYEHASEEYGSDSHVDDELGGRTS